MNVLLLPRTEAAASVYETLVRWSATGLLRPFCVWDAAEIERAPSVRLVAAGEVEELTLGDALAGAVPGEIEFVGFYPLAAGEPADAGFATLVERFLSWVREYVVDLDNEQLLACALAVAPSRPDQAVPPELFRAHWTNLLVAPEDRAGPGAVNQLKDHNGNSGRFVRHAAHAAATVAAIWATPSAQLPDLLAQVEERSGPLRVQVRVVRCFSRVIELGYIADHIAAVAFEPVGGWPRPGGDFDRPEDVDRVVRGVAAAYLKRNGVALGRRPFEAIREDEPEPLGLLAALRALVKQLRDYLRRRPFELVDEAVGRVHAKAARRIESLDSSGKIRVRPWDELPLEGRGLGQLSEQIDSAPLIVEDGAVSTAWTELRQTTLGLVDGSDLPDGVGAWARGPGDRRLVVSDPGRLARDPEIEEEPPHEPLLQRIRAGVQAALEQANARAEALAEPAGGEDGEGEEDEDASESKPRSTWLRGGGWFPALVRRLATYSLLALVATVLAWIQLPLPGAALATLLVGGLLLLGIATEARKAFGRRLIEHDEEAAAELRELNRVLERAQARGDVERLGRRLKELDVWIAILGELVHRPWVREPFEGLELVRATDEKILPTACAVAVARSDRALLKRVGTRARTATFTRGWLAGVYRRAEALAMEAHHLDRGGIGPPPDPTEASQDDESPQQALLAAVRSGAGRSRRDNPMATELLQAIDAASLAELAPVVVPASPSVRPLAPTATWIAPPPGFAGFAKGRGERLVGLRGWRASGVIVAPGVALTAASAVERMVVAIVSADGEPIEVTATRFPAGSGLALVCFDVEQGEVEVETAVVPLRPGIGVVALEATAAGPKARWGYVVGDVTEPTIVYDGGFPATGAPVFDLRGNLVALQGERGVVLPVPEIAELLSSAEADEGGAEALVPPPPEQPTSASEFLAGVAEGNGAGALLPTYWTLPMGTNAIEFSLPPSLSSADVTGPVGRLSEGVAFLRPLRVTMHRVEVTAAVEPEELSACEAAAPAGDPGRAT